jgi:hypothetical protein
MNHKYFGEEDFAALNSKLADYAYQTGAVSIIVYDNSVWAFEHYGSSRYYSCIRKRMKQYFPDLKYLYD